MLKLRTFFQSEKFSSFLSIATMWSKYGIALLLLFISWQWNFALPFLLSIIGSFVVGLLFAALAPKLRWLAKYVVTVGELALLQFFSQAITKSLLLTCVFMFPFLLLVVSESVNAIPLARKHKDNKIVKALGATGDKLYGVERIFRLSLGTYFSIVFGLQSLINECVLLWSFGLIGSVELEPKKVVAQTVTFCKKCARIRVVFIPEDGMLAEVLFIQDKEGEKN